MSTAPDGPLMRALASSSTARRRAATAQLRTFLSGPRTFSAQDMLKIWKALFYCLYMTPRARNQQRLSIELGELALCFESDDNLACFLRAFWVTIAREWEGIDKVRLDKFLFLVRRMVNAGFVTAKEDKDGEYTLDAKRVAAHMAVLADTVLKPRDHKVSTGLRLHVLDVLVDEMCKVDPEGKMDIAVVVEVVQALQKESLVKPVRKRAEETLDDERIVRWGQPAEEKQDEESEDEGEWAGLDE